MEIRTSRTDDDAVRPVVIGTLAWLAIAILCAIFYTPLNAAGFGWFLNVAIAGFALGLLGTWFVRRRRRRLDSVAD